VTKITFLSSTDGATQKRAALLQGEYCTSIRRQSRRLPQNGYYKHAQRRTFIE
jgi:hypothetical protein